MKSIRAYKYRWVILISLMLLMLSVELHWMAFAPIARAADVFYQGQFNPESFINIDFLALVYMIIFVVASIPASYVIDRFGMANSLRVASGMIIIGSIGQWVFATNFQMIVMFQILLALAQPLVLNSVTTVTSQWFPLRDRGFATGLVSMAQYLALGLVMFLSPLFVGTTFGLEGYGTGIDGLLMIYGIACAVMAFLGGVLIRENPPTPASFEPIESFKFWKSYRMIFKNPTLLGLMTVFGFGWAYFITLLTKIDSVSAVTGFSNSNALIGVVMLGSGMLGAVVIPTLSDHFRRRKLFMMICSIGAVPGGVMLVLSSMNIFTDPVSQVVATIGSGLIGFFLMGAGPLSYQYAAELNAQITEAVSQSMLMINSQFIGIFLVIFTSLNASAYLRIELIFMLFIAAISIIMIFRFRESPAIITEDERLQEAVKKEIVHLE